MSNDFGDLLGDLPSSMAKLTDWHWHLVTIGRSNASVWRLAQGDETLFLKSEPAHLLSEMPGEALRLHWLQTAGVPAPRIVFFETSAGRHWLAMTALSGADFTELVDQPERLCRLQASALRQLHALEHATCPFDHSLSARLAAGSANIDAGHVDESDFDDERSGWTAPKVYRWLLDHRPEVEHLVVTHGDASLPNLMADPAGFTGFVDCGRVGLADRWQDLAIACRSIVFNIGKPYLPIFLDAYGAEWDERRFRYYCALDELF